MKKDFSKTNKDSDNSVLIQQLITQNDYLRNYVYMLEQRMNQFQMSQAQPQQTDINSQIKLAVKQAMDEIKSEISIQKKEFGLKEEILNKFNKNKREIIKHKILEMVETRNLTLPELKEVIVDQNKYCSKASFYRYFEELKRKNLVNPVRTGNKEVLKSYRIEVINSKNF
jgi:hypothetical protein